MPRNFTGGWIFSVSPYSFRLSCFLASMDLENILFLVFTGSVLIPHLAHHIAKFRRPCCKSFARMQNVCLDGRPIAANWDKEFC